MGLLKGLHPLLTADLLHALRSMGHGEKTADQMGTSMSIQFTSLAVRQVPSQ